MKIRFSLFLLSLLVLAACGNKTAQAEATPEPEPVDVAAIERDAAALVDAYYAATQSETMDGFDVLLAPDGLYMGSDPARCSTGKRCWKRTAAIRKTPSGRP
jgi:hypothetical protein